MSPRKKIFWGVAGALIILIALWLVLGKGEKGKTIKQVVEKKETPQEVEKAQTVEREEVKKTPEPQPSPAIEPVNKAELKIVGTIKIPEGLKDVILDEESGKPLAFFKEDSIQFLDENGKVKREYKLSCPLKPNKEGCWSNVEFSKGNKFIGVNTIRKYEKEYVEEGEFVMVDKEGNELWRRKHNFFRIIPSPNGEYFLGFADPECGGCPITLVRKNGNKAKIEATRYSEIDISSDGRYIVNATSSYQGSSIFVGMYNEFGKVIWRKEPKDYNLPEFGKETLWDNLVLLSDGNVILSYTQWTPEKRTFLLKLNKHGDLIWKKENNGVLSYHFGEINNEGLILGSSNGQISYINLQNGEAVWTSIDIRKQNALIKKIKISPHKKHIGIFAIYTTGPPTYGFDFSALYIFTMGGHKIFELKTDSEQLQFWFSKSDAEIFVQTGRNIKRYNIVQTKK